MPRTQIRHLRRVERLLRPFAILLLLLLLGFASVPVLGGIDADAINQAGLQRTRAEVFAKDALILLYRQADAHVQAISDLQTTIPLFESEQGLLGSDGRPDVQIVVASERGDYLALDTAIHAILGRPDGPVDPIEVAIILMHDRQYVTTANAVVLLLQQSADRRAWVLFGIEAAIDCVVIAMGTAFGIREDRTLTRLLRLLPAPDDERGRPREGHLF